MEVGVGQLILAPILAFIGYLGYSIRGLRGKVDKTMSEEQVRNLVADKLEVVKAHHESLTHRIRTLELKIDKLIELSTRVDDNNHKHS